MCWCVFNMTDTLTHWGRDKMPAIGETTFSKAFSWMKTYAFRIKFTEVCSQCFIWQYSSIASDTCRRPGDKPLFEPMMITFLTNICVTRSQWVKVHFLKTRNHIWFTRRLEKLLNVSGRIVRLFRAAIRRSAAVASENLLFDSSQRGDSGKMLKAIGHVSLATDSGIPVPYRFMPRHGISFEDSSTNCRILTETENRDSGHSNTVRLTHQWGSVALIQDEFHRKCLLKISIRK